MFKSSNTEKMHEKKTTQLQISTEHKERWKQTTAS